MKKLKKLAALCFTAVLLAILPGSNALTVLADGPVTYCVLYDEEDNEWYYQTGVSHYDPNIEIKEYFLLKDVIKDGDILVVEGLSDGNGVDLDISNVRLSNLTIARAKTAIIRTKAVDECYVLENSIASISGTVTNAYVYENAAVTFHNDISYLEIRAQDDLFAEVGALGTVGHVRGVLNNGVVPYDLYDFAQGKLEIEYGSIQTPEEFYSKTPSAAPAAPAQPAASTQSSAPAASSGSTSSGEYDDVPKTGEGLPVYLWLIGIAAVCCAGKAVIAFKKA